MKLLLLVVGIAGVSCLNGCVGILAGSKQRCYAIKVPFVIVGPCLTQGPVAWPIQK